MTPGTNRCGIGLLWSTIAGIVVLILWGFSRSFVTSTTRAQAEASVEARLAETLADSAVAEMEAHIGLRTNDLGQPLAGLLRRQALLGDDGELDLSPYVSLDETRALMTSAAYSGYSLVEAKARLAFGRPMDAVPYEKRGLCEFSATVSSPGLVRRATRRVQLGRWCTTVLTAVPRPFGNYGIFLASARGLTDANAVNQHRDRAAGLCRTVRRDLKVLARSYPGPTGIALQELADQAFDPEGPQAMPEPFRLPDPGALYGLMESGSPQVLRHLDLAARLGDLVVQAEGAQARLAALATGAGRSDPASVLLAARVAVAQAVQPLYELWSFHRTYAVLAPDQVEGWRLLDDNQGKLTEDYFRRRALYQITQDPGRMDLNASLRKLLDRPVHGVIVVENKAAPLVLTGPVRGRVIVVAGPGGATVRELNASAQGPGMVTLVASSGPVRISGSCGLNLVLVDPPSGRAPVNLVVTPDARIRGCLVATALPPAAQLEGELERDDRVFSGYTSVSGVDEGLHDRYFVGLSPRIHYRKVATP